MRKPVILVVDDVPGALEASGRILREQGWAVETAANGRAVRSLLDSQFIDLIIMDERLDASSERGTKLLADLRRDFPGLTAIILSGVVEVQMAIRGMQAGAVDLVQKHEVAKDSSVLVKAVTRALNATELARDARFYRWEAAHLTFLPEMVGESAPMRQLAMMVRKIAPVGAPVLIHGESGTGKELVARAIHILSKRPEGPFCEVNIRAIPENLIEASLFGVRKGAFTDAKEDRAGYFQTADGGTLFLDEIGDASPEAQVKLLKAIEDKSIQRVGDTKAKQVDVRIVTATNKDLQAEMKEKRFREDLYHRIGTFTISVPPLRERRADIPVLARHFLDRYARTFGLEQKQLTGEALEKLSQHSWPGNVRELDRVIQRALVLTDSSRIDAGSIDIARTGGTTLEELLELRHEPAVHQFMRIHYEHAINRCGGKKNEAAKLLGVERSTFYAHLEKIGMHTPNRPAESKPARDSDGQSPE